MKYLRDNIQGPVGAEYFEGRRAEGWTLRAVEWEQEETAEATSGSAPEAIPYGLEVASGVLAQNPHEMAVLLTMLEMIVKDTSVPVIAEELNRRKLSARHGLQWTAPAVFDLLPRVIEMGPILLRSREWMALRRAAMLA